MTTISENEVFDFLISCKGMEVGHEEAVLCQCEPHKIRCASQETARSLSYQARKFGHDAWSRGKVLTLVLPLYATNLVEKFNILAGR